MMQAVDEIERRLHKAIMSSSHGFWSLGGFIGGSAGAWVIAHWGSEVQSLVTAGVVAAVVLVVVPVLLVYILLQKNIIKGMTVGALKG